MLLAIDVGNSNIVFALMHGASVLHSWRHPTSQPVKPTDLEKEITGAGFKAKDITGGVLGSVVPGVVKDLGAVFKTFTGKILSVVQGTDPRLGLTLGVDEPEKIGVDRVMNCLAGLEDFGAPLIVIDFGTATTFTVLNSKKTILGGVIAPGIETGLKSLHLVAANLPDVAFGYAGAVIGQNTKDAMGSGAFFGTLSLIEGLVERIGRELGATPTVVATGGLSTQFAGKTKAIDHYRPDLTLQGLRLAYERTQES